MEEGGGYILSSTRGRSWSRERMESSFLKRSITDGGGSHVHRAYAERPGEKKGELPKKAKKKGVKGEEQQRHRFKEKDGISKRNAISPRQSQESRRPLQKVRRKGRKQFSEKRRERGSPRSTPKGGGMEKKSVRGRGGNLSRSAFRSGEGDVSEKKSVYKILSGRSGGGKKAWTDKSLIPLRV